MDNKYARITNVNLNLLIITTFGLIMFMNRLVDVLSLLEPEGILNSFEYSFYELNFHIIRQGEEFSRNYTVGIYPILGLIAGIIYNSYIKIKIYINRNVEK